MASFGVVVMLVRMIPVLGRVHRVNRMASGRHPIVIIVTHLRRGIWIVCGGLLRHLLLILFILLLIFLSLLVLRARYSRRINNLLLVGGYNIHVFTIGSTSVARGNRLNVMRGIDGGSNISRIDIVYRLGLVVSMDHLRILGSVGGVRIFRRTLNDRFTSVERFKVWSCSLILIQILVGARGRIVGFLGLVVILRRLDIESFVIVKLIA